MFQREGLESEKFTSTKKPKSEVWTQDKSFSIIAQGSKICPDQGSGYRLSRVLPFNTGYNMLSKTTTKIGLTKL